MFENRNYRFNFDVEVLRVVAIIFVVFEHTIILHDMLNFIPARTRFAFFSGVDLLFVLSGLVFGRSMLALAEGQAFGNRLTLYLAILGRRFARLMPAAFFWILVSVLFVLIAGDPVRLAFLGESLAGAVAALFSYANLAGARCEATETFCSILRPFWSLSLVVQFACIAGLLFAFLKPRWLLLFLALAILAQLAWPRPVYSLGWYVRTEGMAAGLLLAILTYRGTIGTATSPRIRWALRAVILAGLVLLPFITGLPAKSPYQTSFISLLCIVIVAAVAGNADLLFRNRVTEPVIRYLGSRAYAIFLSNVFAYLLLRYAVDRDIVLANKGLFLALALVLILVVSEISYRFVERPWTAFGNAVFAREEKLPMRRRTLLLCLIMLAGLGGVFAATRAEHLMLNVQRAGSGSYLSPRIDGKLVEITPFEWKPEEIPPPEATRRTAALLCRRLGHRDVLDFRPDRLQDPRVERFVNFVSFETRPFDRGLFYFKRLQCIG